MLIAVVVSGGTALEDTVIAPERTQGLVALATQVTHNLITLQGLGKLVAAEILEGKAEESALDKAIMLKEKNSQNSFFKV